MIKNLSKKLLNGTIIGFIFAVSVAVFGGINTILYLNNFAEDITWMRDNEIAGRNYILKSKIYIRDLNMEVRNLLLSEDEISKNSSISEIKKAGKNLLKTLKRAKPLFYSKEGKQIITQSLSSAESLIRESDIIISSYTNNNELEANKKTYGRFKDDTILFDDLMIKLEKIKAANDSAIYKKLITSQKITIIIILVILSLTVIFRIILVVYDHKKVRRKKGCN